MVLGSAVWLMIGAFDALWAVVLDDLDTAVWISNLGITLFALPLILLGAAGGRLSQRVGPFRVATVGLLLGAMFMLLYGLVPTGGAMFAVAMFHAVSDGITVSSTGVAAGLVVPPERQAGGQGVLGACATLTAGLTASAHRHHLRARRAHRRVRNCRRADGHVRGDRRHARPRGVAPARRTRRPAGGARRSDALSHGGPADRQVGEPSLRGDVG